MVTKGIDMKVILASNSPRRKELLSKLGIDFECIPSQREEKFHSVLPAEIVKELSFGKAEDRLAQCLEKEVLVIGSDTIVAYEDEILGKPKSKEDAYRMLSMLQGRTHFVYTGVTLLYRNDKVVTENIFEEHTKVTMYPMTEEEILSYIKTGEPMDKAGAYAIQGKCAVYIQKIEGEYDTVVGFPVARFFQELKKMKLKEQIFLKEKKNEDDKINCK